MAECCLQPQSAARRCSGEAARSDANFRVSARRARLCGLINSCPSAENHTFQPLWQIRDKRGRISCHIEDGRMSASCSKVSFALPSVSRECGRLCVQWLKRYRSSLNSSMNRMIHLAGDCGARAARWNLPVHWIKYIGISVTIYRLT